MHDIRLDYINNIEQRAIDMMTALRKQFIALDRSIQDIELSYPEINGENQMALRSASLARTNLEIASHFAIKALCLCGEL